MNCTAHISNGIGEVSSTTPPWKWCGRVNELLVEEYKGFKKAEPATFWSLSINRGEKMVFDSQEEAEAIYRILSKGIV